MTLEEAKSYISLALKEGYYSEDQFSGMTDEELIKFAEEEGEKGDILASEEVEE